MVLGGDRDGAARDDELAVEFDALGGAAGVLEADGVRARHLIIAARDGDSHRAARNQAARVAADALAALAAVGDGQGAVVHHEGHVGLDAGRGGEVREVGVVHAAGNGERSLAAVDADGAVGGDGLLSLLLDRDVQRAAADHDRVFAADAVSLGGIDADRRAVQHADIVVGGDAGLAAGRSYAERTAAAEDELRFAEEGAFLVFAFGRLRVFAAVGELVGAVHDHERTFLVLVVDGRAVGIRQVEAVQDDGLLLLAIDLEESVGGRSGELVADLLGACVVHGHVVAVDGHDAVVVARHRSARGAERDGNGSVEGRVRNRVLFIFQFKGVFDGGVRIDRVHRIIGVAFVALPVRVERVVQGAAAADQQQREQEGGYQSFHIGSVLVTTGLEAKMLPISAGFSERAEIFNEWNKSVYLLI